MESLVHHCHHAEFSDGESRSRHSSASCNGCCDCEAADTLLSMRHLRGSNSADVRKAAAVPPRLRSKQYRDNYFGDNKVQLERKNVRICSRTWPSQEACRISLIKFFCLGIHNFHLATNSGHSTRFDATDQRATNNNDIKQANVNHCDWLS